MKYNYTVLLSLITFIVLSGCVATHQQIIKLKSIFDEKQALEMLEQGNNKIIGSALIRQSGGGVVTCAGIEVILYPATEYAKERIKYIYGSIEKAYRDYNQPQQRYLIQKRGDRLGAIETIPEIVFEPDYEFYHFCTRKSIGDAQGNFEFDKLKDGEYFMFTTITWNVYQLGTQGGTLMLKVKVKDGETKKIVLAP